MVNDTKRSARLRGKGIEMRRIFAGLFLSLDGVMESPEKWISPYYRSDEIGHEIESRMAAADTLLLGRRTYQVFASYWPNTTSDAQFAGWMNNTPKLVASTTLKTVEWKNSSLIKGSVVEEITRLKQQQGKNIHVIGSATLVRSLLRAGLLDEIGLMIYPIVLGTGNRLFDDGSDQTALRLVGAKTFSTGVVSLRYEPAGK